VIAVRLACLLLWAAATAAAEYPLRPITLVAPFGPGGASDLAARNLAGAGARQGAALLVVNRVGAGGTVGAGVVRRARADGYTLLLARVGPNALAPALQQPAPYSWDGFTLLGLLELNPFVFVVRADSPWRSLQDLVDAVRAHPGQPVCGTSGPRSLLSVGVLMLLNAAGLPADSVVMLPYRGGGGATVALLGGHVDFLGINLGSVMAQIHAGKLRALAVSGEARSAVIPAVPTMAEAGFARLGALQGWSGLWGPPGLSAEVTDYWERSLQRLAGDLEWIAATRSRGSVPAVLTPDDTRAFVADQVRRYQALRGAIGGPGGAW